MSPRRALKVLFYICALIVATLIVYKIYLNFFEGDIEAVHARQIDTIQKTLRDRQQFRFAVVGNINNSVGVFERKIIPMLNRAELDFVISAGNAVSGGGEDKYRAIYQTFSHLHTPYVLTFGEKEFGNFGAFRFYEHFGPYVFSFRAANSRFIFLDTTGKTPRDWQLHWLRNLLDTDDPAQHRFVFMGHPLRPQVDDVVFDNNDNYLQDSKFAADLQELFDRHEVDAVFAANLPLFAREHHRKTHYIITGGSGGLVLNDDTSFYHFVEVEVDGADLDIGLTKLDIGQHQLLKTLESLWFFVHSLFYVGYLNFILIIGILLLITIKLYNLIMVERDYYPRFDLDPSAYLDRPLRVAMFTNNYLPFIGGVPLSIERLRRGLLELGHKVFIVAPRYRDQPRDEEDVLRVPALLRFGDKREFRLANIFLPGIRRRVAAFRPDIIHLHHPFWLGRLGLWLARYLQVPALYTYHTRLEHYAHYVPLPGLLFRNLISHALIRHFANRCDGVIVPTHSAEEYLRMIGVRTPTYVQPTGIDFERFQNVDEERLQRLRRELGLRPIPTLISVSRLTREKNIDFIIDAMQQLHASDCEPFQLLVIGDGAERQRLQDKIDALGLHDTVILTGPADPDDIAQYYQLGQIFLFASKSETQGMVVLEAMAAGLPVVAIRSSGIDDVVREGENGFKTAEDTGLWLQRIRKLLDDETLRRRMSEQARGTARDHAIDRFATHVASIYGRVLATRSKSRTRD